MRPSPDLIVGHDGQERWTLVLPQAIGITAFVYFVFDRVMHIPWPPTLLG